MEQTQLTVEFTKQDLRRLIVPLVIEQLLAITVGLCDSVMVSQVGEAAISAVSLVDTVNVLLVNAYSALATGGAVIAGQYLGRREQAKAGHAGEQLLLFMTEVSLAVMVLFYLCKGFVLGVVFGQVEPDVAAYANTYYMIVEASIPFLAIYNAGAALFRVMGNSKISMWVSLGMNLVNVIGNAILIFGLHRGVEGVAIPTTVSRMVAAAAMLVLLRRKDLPMHVERLSLRHDRYVVKNILRFGVPNGLESGMFQLGKILLLSTVSVLGTASVAANAIGNTVTTFQCVPGNALGLAMVTVVSRCMGAGSYTQARYYTKKLLAKTYLYMAGTISLVLVLLPGTQGIYGLLIGFIVLTQVGILGGDPNVSAVKGLLYLAACLPMAIVGLVSARWQTKASIASISLLVKKPEQFGKAMTLPVMVETYAVLALLISILAIFGIGGLSV